MEQEPKFISEVHSEDKNEKDKKWEKWVKRGLKTKEDYKEFLFDYFKEMSVIINEFVDNFKKGNKGKESTNEEFLDKFKKSGIIEKYFEEIKGEEAQKESIRVLQVLNEIIINNREIKDEEMQDVLPNTKDGFRALKMIYQGCELSNGVEKLKAE